MVSFAKIPDLLGYLVLTEYGAVLESDGELKNDENCANIVTSLINLADRYVIVYQLFYCDIQNNKIIVFESFQCGRQHIAEERLPKNIDNF